MTIALIRHRVLAAVEHSSVIGTKVGSLVDIGANRGQFSLACRAINPLAAIHAFEPLPTASSKFRDVFNQDVAVTLHEAAVGPQNSIATIHVSKKDDSSSLLPIGQLQTTFFPGTQESHTQEIKVVRLVDVLGTKPLARPSWLKIDVQGYELQVLRGCDELLHQFDYIYCECSFVQLYEGQALASEVITFLVARRFDIRGVHNVTHSADGSTIQADLLFARQKNRSDELLS